MKPTARWKKALFAVFTIALAFAGAEYGLWRAGIATVAERGDPFRGFAGDLPVFERRGEVFTSDRPAHRHTFNPQSFRAEKPARGYRVFVLGGSSAYGFPRAAEAAFPAILDDLLRAAHPDREIEVVNAAGISYGSHRLRILAHELLRHAPDLLIVYGGHNEFIEEQVHRTLRARLRPPRGIQRILHRSHVYGGLHRLLAPPRGRRDWQAGAAGELQPRVRREFGKPLPLERRAELEGFFADNLQAIVELARRHDAEVLLCTVPANLRGWRPEREIDGPRLEPETRATWSAAVKRGEAALDAGRADEALEPLRLATELAPGDGPTWYLLARAEEERGAFEAAREAYARALEVDARPYRATPAINAAIRRIAAAAGLPLVDVERTFESRSPGGIVGFELIEDYVHPTLAGHELIAAEVWRALRQADLPEPTSVGFDATLGKVLEARRVDGPDELEPAWVYNQGMLLANQGRFTDARARLEQAVGLAPQWADAHFSLGSVALRLGDIDLASGCYETAERLDPDVADLGLAWYNLGVALAEAGRDEEALARFRRAVALRPTDAHARNNLATLLARRGDLRGAVRELETAIELDPGHPHAAANLERLRRAVSSGR